MNAIQKITKNIGSLFISQILNYLLVFIYSIVMIRYLGVTEFGILSFGLALISILGIFTDLGLNTLMTREVARNKSLGKKFLNNVISIKIILSFTIFFLVFIMVNFLNYPQTTADVIYFLILSLIFTSISSSLYSIFQAYEKLEYQAIGIVLNSLLMLISIFIAVYLRLSVLGFAFIYVVVSFILLIYYLLITSKKFIFPKIEIDWNFSKKQIVLALQFGLIGVFSTIYVWIDSLMLFSLVGDQAVGYYSVAYRLILVLLFIPSVVAMAIFPVMSRLYGESSNSLKTIVEKYFKLMMLIGIPIGIFTTVFAREIINLLFGNEYAPATLALQILIWATVFTFANTTFVQLFQSINRQMLVTKITGIGLLTNIIINLILIPKISFIGASIATLITEGLVAILLIICTYHTKYSLKINNTLIYLTKIIISSLIMGIFIYEFKYLNLLILIAISIIIYLFIISITQVLDKEDKNLLREIIK